MSARNGQQKLAILCSVLIPLAQAATPFCATAADLQYTALSHPPGMSDPGPKSSLHGEISQVLPSAIISDIRNKINDIIKSASTDASKNSFEIFSYAQILLSQLDALANSVDSKGTKLVDRIMSDLDKKERQAVSDFQQSVNTLSEQRDLTARQVKDALNSTSIALSVLPGSKDYPRINSVTPYYLARSILENSSDPRIPLSFDGLFLDQGGKPSLQIRESDCKLLSESSQRLLFSCPKEIFQSDSSLQSVDYISGRLLVDQKLTLFDRLLNRRAKSRNYAVGLAVLPATLGLVSLSSLNEAVARTIPESTTVQAVARRRSFFDRNNYCADARTGTWTVLKSDSSPNTRIDTSVAPAVVVYGADRGHSYNLQQHTDSNIVIGYSLDNRRSQSEKFGCASGAFNDRRARLGVHVDYRENISTTTPSRSEVVKPREVVDVVTSAPLSWGNDMLITLPSNSLSFTLSVRLFDGRSIVITPDSLSRRDKFFDVAYDNIAKTVIVRPIPLDRLP